MTGLDAIMMGLVGALSVFPGISRTGIISSYATVRGAETQNGATWAILLGIPALLFAICFDLFSYIIFGVFSVSFIIIMQYFLAGVAAFCGGYAGISLFKIVINRSGFSGFAYYSIGAAIFTFILYLIT